MDFGLKTAHTPHSNSRRFIRIGLAGLQTHIVRLRLLTQTRRSGFGLGHILSMTRSFDAKDNAHRADRPNPHPFGTSVMLPADSLRGKEARQKQVVIGHRGRSTK